MIYSIFRNNILIIKVKPNDSSELSQKKQNEDIIRLNFTLDNPIEFKIGDNIVFEKTEQQYYLNKLPRSLESPKNNQYECIFEGPIHELRKTKVFLTTGEYKDYKYPLTGNAETFLQFIVNNLNENSSGYTVGSFKDTETTTIDFNNWNVFEAITQLSEELNFSWYLDNKVLHFDENPEESTYVFQVGRLSGFTQLIRTRIESENIETVVYGYGSTENMPPRTAEEGQTYDSPLLTENRLAFSGVDGESKLENNVDLFGRIESVQEFDDIKPEFTGVVSEIDETNTRIFFDDSIDFDINDQLLAGIFPKITFLTGKLIGLTFNISYELATDKITMDLYSDESGSYPNDLIFAEIDDQYKLFDLVMPEIYVTDASSRLEAATQEYMNTQSNALQSYEGALDKEYIQKGNIVLNLGVKIRVISSAFLIDNLYEIKELIQSITEPSKYTVKFGDVLIVGLVISIKNNNFNTKQSIYNVSKNSVTNNQVTNIIGETEEWVSL